MSYWDSCFLAQAGSASVKIRPSKGKLGLLTKSIASSITQDTGISFEGNTFRSLLKMNSVKSW